MIRKYYDIELTEPAGGSAQDSQGEKGEAVTDDSIPAIEYANLMFGDENGKNAKEWGIACSAFLAGGFNKRDELRASTPSPLTKEWTRASEKIINCDTLKVMKWENGDAEWIGNIILELAELKPAFYHTLLYKDIPAQSTGEVNINQLENLRP